MPSLTIDIANLELFQEMRESVSVKRVDLDSDPTGDTFADVAADVNIAIVPSFSSRVSLQGGTSVRSTGQVLSKSEYNGLLESPIEALREGDIILRADGKYPQKFYISETPAILGNVQWLELSTTRG